jgi:hypothetical protein
MTYWQGTVGPKDDFGLEIEDEFVDGRTFGGSWAIMTPRSHRKSGVGLGTGRGQRYERQEDGRWLKVEG